MKRIKMSPEYLRCRTLGHAWDQTQIPFQRSGIFGRRGHTGARMSFRCTSCGAVRHDIISPSTGTLLQRSYEYPPGYSLDPDHRPTRDEFRVHLLRVELRREKQLGRS